MRLSPLIILTFSTLYLQSNGQGSFFGGLQVNSDFYDRDEKVGATGTPHYDNLKSSTDGWLNLDYINDKYGFDLGIRFDMYLNSNLHDPGTPYTDLGIGTWYIRKRFDKFRITGGYFYEQFGSGIVFRAFEDRTLGIDNAILGAHIEADPVEKLKIKAFAGVQKNRLSFYKPIIIGASAESDLSIGDKVQFIPGFSIVNRTMDQSSMDFVVSTIESYDPENRFVPKYNVYVYGGYNTLNIGDFSWYLEAAGKTSEAIPNAENDLVNKPGNVVYSTLNYSIKKLGAAIQFKRTENFYFRTSPNEILLDGILNFIPPVTRQNSLRLPARYNAVVQDLEELAYSADLTYSPIIRKLTVNLNYSESRDFDNELKFKELFGDVELKFKKKWKADVGMQYIEYDQEFYEAESYGSYRLVKAFTPFVEFTYKINRKHSLTFDLQNQLTQQDFGSWAFILVEYNLAPWFSLAVSDMYNYDPNPERIADKTHYYQFFGSFTYNTHVVTLSYVKQVEGIVCTGGVCRYEPAFSGVKLTLNSTF